MARDEEVSLQRFVGTIGVHVQGVSCMLIHYRWHMEVVGVVTQIAWCSMPHAAYERRCAHTNACS
jgi:hypothetical protein